MSISDTRNMETAEHDASDASIGIRLKRLREQKGLSIQEVSEKTHISSSNLTAIEAELFDNLPADTFVRGLVNIYGSHLGLDGTETAKLFLEERDRRQPRRKKNRLGKQAHSLAPKKLAEPSHISSATVATILLLLIVVSFTTFCLYTGWNPFAYFLKQGQQSPPPLSGTMVPGASYKEAATTDLSKTAPAKSTSGTSSAEPQKDINDLNTSATPSDN